MRKTWFLILRGPDGREYPALVYDALPSSLRQSSILYGWRLDRLQYAKRAAEMSLGELYRAFCGCRDRGRLPPDNRADPPKAADAAKPLYGHRETVRAQCPDLPGEPYPDPDDIRPRPGAPAFIRAE